MVGKIGKMNGIESLKKTYRIVMGLTLATSVLVAVILSVFSAGNVLLLCAVTLTAIVLLFLYHGFAANLFYFKALENDPEGVARFYMVHLMIKFIVGAVIAFAGSMVLGTPLKKVFVITFALVFFMTLIAESYAFVQIEKKKHLNETIQ